MLNFPFSSKSFAIDLGNNNTLLTDQDGDFTAQPSYIAFDSNTHQVKAIGDAALRDPQKFRPVLFE
jgi:rod shape-determining protein MreB and related proteins